ncbi:MAG TPA: phage tail sheath C-terminal domain-containing protein, partial [Allosphingosinicella sp.]|nr:phage tail sheath C-terminal domain-containing protein [Allosphingosinicella sp.]
APAVRYSNAEQENLNAPPSGLSVNAIRSFTGRGTLVWGARTLDGNSADFRYVSVRRTLIWLEQSIRPGIAPFVFEPNDASTWIKVRAMIENFLTNVWRQGALMGDRPKDAFFVTCGLGQTMTAQDLLDNILIVGIGVAPVRPAEFVVLTIRLEMAPS